MQGTFSVSVTPLPGDFSKIELKQLRSSNKWNIRSIKCIYRTTDYTIILFFNSTHDSNFVLKNEINDVIALDY